MRGVEAWVPFNMRTSTRHVRCRVLRANQPAEPAKEGAASRYHHAVKQADSLESFLDDPVGRWIAAGTSVTWCASPSLAGTTVWGSPDAETTRAIVGPFDALWARTMADQVDVIGDARRVEQIDPGALAVVFQWNVERRADGVARIRQQLGIIKPGIIGMTLSGILPTVGETHPFRVLHDALEAHRLLGDGSDALGREVEDIVERVSGIGQELLAVREVLRTQHGAVTLTDCARLLGSSTRSLQRTLGALGTSFQRELRDARFAEARELLASTDEKVASIAHRVGVTESALTQLVRERTGQTPAELRRQRGSG